MDSMDGKCPDPLPAKPLAVQDHAMSLGHPTAPAPRISPAEQQAGWWGVKCVTGLVAIFRYLWPGMAQLGHWVPTEHGLYNMLYTLDTLYNLG